MEDPRRGGALLDRTVIVCNTSSMPVAAREASVYTGVTIGEYYRQMGLDVLLIADSTSRWAQALRETSGRLEEIPGEEGYPAYLDSAIRALYDRAGVVRTHEGATGSLTIVGAVSPAGGDFDEPVTRSTLAAVKTFLGLSADRAYKRFYPAIDPLLSWSRVEQRFTRHWEQVGAPALPVQARALRRLLEEGEEVAEMLRVTGEEGIALADVIRLEKARFADAVFLQQDAFDPVDASAPPARQLALLALVMAVAERPIALEGRDEVRRLFQRLTAIGRNLNYAPDGSPDRARLEAELMAELDAASAPTRNAGRDDPDGPTDGHTDVQAA
jgi:V/A-type H+-transporting ATPase subunit A